MALREGKRKAYTAVRQWEAPSRGKMVHVDSGAVAGSWGPPAGLSCLDRVSPRASLNLAGKKGPARPCLSLSQGMGSESRQPE